MVSPSNEWSIDEQLRLFTGRYINKVVMKDKPAGCGIKCIGMADSNTKLPLWWSTTGLGEERLTVKRNEIYGYCNEFPIVELKTECYQVGNVYFIFVLDNGAFVISTNCAVLFQKGRIKVLSKLNEKQKEKFNVTSYKVYKLVPYIVAYYNKKMNGVDVIDQLISSHDRHQRQSSWKTSLIYTAIKMAETTSFTINKRLF